MKFVRPLSLPYGILRPILYINKNEQSLLFSYEKVQALHFTSGSLQFILL